MGLFGSFKKSAAGKYATPILIDTPYRDNATNLIYNLLFCDDPALYKMQVPPPYSHPFDILFSETLNVIALQKIIDDINGDPRIKVLACNKQLLNGIQPRKKELYAVIVEVGLELGPDVLASFKNGTARYINQSGKILIWETITDSNVNAVTNDLFTNSQQIVNQIGAWGKPRKPHPPNGYTRISFLVSDGLYFGEGPTNVLFNDKLATAAWQMQHN